MMKHAHYIYYNIYCMSKHADMMEHVQFQSINMMMVIRELAYKIAENKIFKYIFKLLYHSETAISTHPSVLACIIWGRQCLIFQLLLQPHERCEVTVWTDPWQRTKIQDPFGILTSTVVSAQRFERVILSMRLFFIRLIYIKIKYILYMPIRKRLHQQPATGPTTHYN